MISVARRSAVIFVLTCAGLTCIAGSAQAQSKVSIGPNAYPTKPVRVVISSALGGGLNVVTRLVLDRLSVRLGTAFIADVQSGGTGVIAARLVADAPPDGYTLLSSSNSFVINGVLKAVPFDIRQTFAPVARMTTQYYLGFAHSSVPANSFRELVTYIKNNPGKLNFGSSGNGSVPHLGMEIIKSTLGVDVVHIPYKGNGPANVDLVAGRIQLLFGSLSVNQLVKTGHVKLIAVMSTSRLPQYPDTATVAESGLPGYELSNTYSLYAPIKTSSAIIAGLNKEIAQIVNAPDVKEKFAADSSEASPPYTPEELRKLFLAEFDKWDKVVKSANIKLEE